MCNVQKTVVKHAFHRKRSINNEILSLVVSETEFHLCKEGTPAISLLSPSKGKYFTKLR